MAKLIQITGDGSRASSYCEYCSQAKGHTAMVVHKLKFQSADVLRDHMREFYGGKKEEDPWIHSQITWWHFVHRYYGEQAAALNLPLWQHYLESHGVRVKRKYQPEQFIEREL